MISLFNISATGDIRMAASARELHKYLEISEPFEKWWSQIKDYQVEDDEYIVVNDLSVGTLICDWELREDSNDDIYLSLDLAKHIAFVSKTDNGIRLRSLLVEYERVFLNTNHSITGKYNNKELKYAFSILIDNGFRAPKTNPNIEKIGLSQLHQ